MLSWGPRGEVDGGFDTFLWRIVRLLWLFESEHFWSLMLRSDILGTFGDSSCDHSVVSFLSDPFIWDCIICVASRFLKGRCCCYHYYQPWYIIMFVIHTYLKYGVVQETLFRISHIGVWILVLPIASQLKWPLVRYLASELLFTHLWTGGITASSHELL